jgi:hypothetical protein
MSMAQSARHTTFFLMTFFLPRFVSALCPLLSAPSHVITLSARANTFCEIVGPSTWAAYDECTLTQFFI